MELFPQQLPYPYVHLSLSSYLLYYYVVAIVPANVEQNGTAKTTYSTQTMPTAYCLLQIMYLRPTICSMWTTGTRDQRLKIKIIQ